MVQKAKQYVLWLIWKIHLPIFVVVYFQLHSFEYVTDGNPSFKADRCLERDINTA